MTNASRRCPVRYPCRWTTSAIKSVGSEGLEPSPGGLRVRCAAASTLIPISRRGRSRTLDLTLIRGLLSPLSYTPAMRVGPEGLEPRAPRAAWSAGLKVRCAAVTPRPCTWSGRMGFNRVNIASLLFLELRQMVALRIALQRHVVISRVRATSPRLPLPTSLSNQSGWQDSNLRLRAPKARGFAATLHPVYQVRTAGFEPRAPTEGWSLLAPSQARYPFLRYVLSSVARTNAARRCPESNPPFRLEGPMSSTDRRTSRISAHPKRQVGREVLEPSSPGLQPGATPSQLPAQRKKPGVTRTCDTGFLENPS